MASCRNRFQHSRLACRIVLRSLRLASRKRPMPAGPRHTTPTSFHSFAGSSVRHHCLPCSYHHPVHLLRCAAVVQKLLPSRTPTPPIACLSSSITLCRSFISVAAPLPPPWPPTYQVSHPSCALGWRSSPPPPARFRESPPGPTPMPLRPSALAAVSVRRPLASWVAPWQHPGRPR